jgi:hypothetical protein
VQSKTPVGKIRVLVDDVNIAEYAYSPKTTLSDIKKITIPDTGVEKHIITVLAIDEAGGYGKTSVTVTAGGSDTVAPEILDNKVSVVKKGENQYIVTMLFVDEASAVK